MEVSNVYLPQEAILKVLKYLEPETLAKVRLVCRKFRELADDQSLYAPEILPIKISNSKAEYQKYLFDQSIEALPTLAIPYEVHIVTFANSFNPAEMTAPMMKGVDRNGIKFFMIRFRENGTLRLQLFRKTNTPFWSTLGPSHLVAGGIISYGFFHAFDDLKAAMRTGRSGDKVIE